MTGRSRACHDSELPKANANGIEIEHEIFGEPTGRPLLLVMGLGAQMIVWPDEFCEELAANGHRVIRFDNRDIGLSTKFEDAGIPNVSELMGRAARGESIEVPYLLLDMADLDHVDDREPGSPARKFGRDRAIDATASRRA